MSYRIALLAGILILGGCADPRSHGPFFEGFPKTPEVAVADRYRESDALILDTGEISPDPRSLESVSQPRPETRYTTRPSAGPPRSAW
jgi:hypothetical protein